MMPSVSKLETQLAALQNAALHTNWHDDQGLVDLSAKLLELQKLLVDQPSLFKAEGSHLQQVVSLVASVRLTATFVLELEQHKEEQLKSTRQEVGNVLSRSVSSEQSLDPHVEHIAANDQVNSSILRQWFLDHLDDPFPSREEKEQLSRASASAITADPSSNEKPLDYSQVMLWYINSRRRSGWTGFFRRFAWEDKQRLAALFEALREGASEDDDNDSSNRKLEALLSLDRNGRRLSSAQLNKEVRECREAYDKIMDWVRQGTRQKVGDWLDEIVAAADRKRERRRLKRSKKLDAAASAARKAAVDAVANGTLVSDDEGEGKDVVTLRHPAPQQHQRQALGHGLPPHRRVTRSMAVVKGEHGSPGPAQLFDELAPSDSASRNVSGNSTLSSLEASGPPPLIGGSVGRTAAYRNPSSSTDSSLYSSSGSLHSHLYAHGGGSHLSQSSFSLSAGGYPTHDSSELHEGFVSASPSIDLVNLPPHLSFGRFGGVTSYESSLYEGGAPSFDFAVPAPGGISLYQHHPQPQSVSMTFTVSASGSTPGPTTPMPTPMPSVLQLPGSTTSSTPLDPALVPIELQHQHFSAQLLGPPAPYRTPSPTTPLKPSGPHPHQRQHSGTGSSFAPHARSNSSVHSPLVRRLPVARKRTSGKVPPTPRPGVRYTGGSAGHANSHSALVGLGISGVALGEVEQNSPGNNGGSGKA